MGQKTHTEGDFWGLVDKSGDGCWPFKGHIPWHGYGLFGMNKRCWRAHRLAYTLSKGPIPKGLVVMHSCDSPSCCRPDHLSLGTVADNNKDCKDKGRNAFGDRQGARKHPESVSRGEQRWKAKANAEMVRKIREEYAAGEVTQLELARRYGFDRQGAISAIITRRTWKHVT